MYKDVREVCHGDGDVSTEDNLNEGSSDAPPIGDQGQENANQGNAVASNTENLVRLEVFDSPPRKWAKIDLPKRQQAALKRSNDMLFSLADVNRPPYQLL